jgi:hypothetical protein
VGVWKKANPAPRAPKGPLKAQRPSTSARARFAPPFFTLLAFVAAFVAVFLPARRASALGSLDTISTLAGLCDPSGASVPAPPGPFVIVEDEATLVAAALSPGISDPRGASMSAPLFTIAMSADAIAALDDSRCERGPSALPTAQDDGQQHDATPPLTIDPAILSSLPLFVVTTAPPESLTPVSAGAPRQPFLRAVEHPPR